MTFEEAEAEFAVREKRKEREAAEKKQKEDQEEAEKERLAIEAEIARKEEIRRINAERERQYQEAMREE